MFLDTRNKKYIINCLFVILLIVIYTTFHIYQFINDEPLRNTEHNYFGSAFCLTSAYTSRLYKSRWGYTVVSLHFEASAFPRDYTLP